MIELINSFLLENKINEMLVSGQSNFVKCLIDERNNKIFVKGEDMDNSEINSYFHMKKYERNNNLLEGRLNELSNPNTNLDLFVFGKLKKEILTAIECYQLKELYIEERKF